MKDAKNVYQLGLSKVVRAVERMKRSYSEFVARVESNAMLARERDVVIVYPTNADVCLFFILGDFRLIG